MPEQELWIGTGGPLLYDSTVTDDEDPDFGNDETYVASDWEAADNPDPTYMPTDLTKPGSVKLPNQGYIDEAPTETNHFARMVDISGTIALLAVADIDAPKTELNAEAGSVGQMLVVYEIVGGTVQDNVTLYTYDTETLVEASPFILQAATSGAWVARGGRYHADDMHFQAGKRLYFDPDTYIFYDAGSSKLKIVVDGTTEAQFG